MSLVLKLKFLLLRLYILLFFFKFLFDVGFYWDILQAILVKFISIIYYICYNIKITVMVILSKYFLIKNGLNLYT